MTAEIDVAVVGGGPAGLAAAVGLQRAGARVVVLEREAALGGIARHSDHTGYGLREFHRVLRGPVYARRWAERTDVAGVDTRLSTTVTGFQGGEARTHRLYLTSAAGIEELAARAIVLATGTRERPRSARLIPGTRPLGVMTTGTLQQLAASPGVPIGSRAVVVGAEHVSFSAVLTLAHAGCRPIAIVTPEPRHQSYRALRWATATRHRVPVLTNTAVSAIRGRPRVEAVELTDVVSGATRALECDTVVFTGDWVPDHELARRGGLAIDAGTRAPRVDGALRTDTPGVFAAGNLLHGAETAGVCAASGTWVARSVLDWLADDRAWPSADAVAIRCEPPLLWVSPNAVVPGGASVPHGHLLARCAAFTRGARVSAHQDGAELWSGRLHRTVPTMPVHVPARWLAQVRAGAPVTLRLEI